MAGAQIIRLLIRLVLAGVFLYAGIIKVLDPAGFVVSIEAYRVVPYSVAAAVAYYLPWLEIVTALALLWPRAQRPAAVLLAVLMAVFMALLLAAWARGLDINCGCFGSAEDPANYPLLLVRDIALLLAALFCASGWGEKQRLQPAQETYLK